MAVSEVRSWNFVGCNNFARHIVLKIKFVFMFSPLQTIVRNFTEI